MSVLANTISTFIPSQVPAYIRDNYPNFVALLQQYFQFLENTTYNGTVYQIRNLQNYKDIDSTTPEFYQYFINEFLPYFPSQTAYSLQKLLKIATQFYQAKGNQNSYEFLFRVLYGLDAEIYYPKNNVLRLSAGNWNQPQALKLTLTGNNVNFNVALLVGRQGVGSLSNTTCMIENVFITVDPTLNQQIIEIFVSNISKEFVPGESLNVIYGFNANGSPQIFSEPIIGSLSEIDIDPHNQGLGYVGTKLYANGAIQYNGDPVSIIGGLANSNLAIEAVAYVGNVSLGTITGVTVENGGYGYSVYPNTIVTVVDGPGGTGSGANIIVSEIDTANQVELILNQDSIAFKANVVIGAANYVFANTSCANLAQTFANAFTFYALNVAPIKSIFVVSGGSDFNEVPTLNLRSMFDSDFSTGLYDAYIADPNETTYTNWITARPNIADLGVIAAIQVLTSGASYNANTDSMFVDSEIGGNATFDIVTNAPSGNIIEVAVTNGGYGYYTLANPLMPVVFVANSSNVDNASAGSGATFKAWGFNQGESLSLSVSQIGQIEDIRLVNRGFDYIETPLVSLRNMDVVVQPLPTEDLYFQSDYVYQGASINAATFIANVDGFNFNTNTLRLYNYDGTLNLSQNLVGANFNSSPLSSNTYGDGKAKANAQFLGGLIDFPGFWIGTAGFLSADQRFQDNAEYQNYSYLIKVEKTLKSYQQAVQNIVHPAGTLMLGLCTVTDERPSDGTKHVENIQIANTTNLTGNVTCNAFGNGYVTGLGTEFTGNINVGDLFMINNNDSLRMQTKLVTNVFNSTALKLESNTMIFIENGLYTTHGSNVLVYNNELTDLVVGDILQTNVANNVQTSIVQVVVSADSVEVNTVFSSNGSNTFFMLYPSMANVNYTWFDPN